MIYEEHTLVTTSVNEKNTCPPPLAVLCVKYNHDEC